jgi:hypothetical protein
VKRAFVGIAVACVKMAKPMASAVRMLLPVSDRCCF